jgi:hypothetical protein
MSTSGNMRLYTWSCLACGASNAPAMTLCDVCSCSSRPTAAQVLAHRQRHLGAGGQVPSSGDGVELPKPRGRSLAQGLQDRIVTILRSASHWLLRRSAIDWALAFAVVAGASAVMGIYAIGLMAAGPSRGGSDPLPIVMIVCAYATLAAAAGAVGMFAVHVLKWLWRLAQPRQ